MTHASMVFPGEETALGMQADLFGAGREVYERADRYVIDRICCDLESIGYEVVPVAIPACAVGAPHERMRVFFLCHDATHTHSDGGSPQTERKRSADVEDNEQSKPILGGHNPENTLGVRREGCRPKKESRERKQWEFGAGDNEWLHGKAGIAADPGGLFGWGLCGQEPAEQEAFEVDSDDCIRSWWRDFPTVAPVCGADDGFSDRLSRDAVFAGDNPSRRKGTFNYWREKSIEALGNAIVPQVIYEIFRMIKQIEITTKHNN